jgi:uncharacterized protein (DUF2336 family)
MSSVQPANGLPERRMITADSFRALKLKLAGTHRQPAAPPAHVLPEIIETLPEPAISLVVPPIQEAAEPDIAPLPDPVPAWDAAESMDEPIPDHGETEVHAATDSPAELPFLPDIAAEDPPAAPAETLAPEPNDAPIAIASEEEAEPETSLVEEPTEPASAPLPPSKPAFVERRVLERSQPENAEAGVTAHALLDIMAIPTEGSLPQERALANDTLLRLIPRMPVKSLRHLAERVCLMEAPSQLLVRRLINDPRIEVSGPLLEHAMIVDDSDLIAVAQSRNPAKLKLIARRRIISPALSEALIQSNDVETLINLVRNQGASFSIESMWHLTRFAAAHPVLQAPLVTRQDTPSPIAFQLFWRLPSELRRYVLSRFLTDSETITRILTMNRENDGGSDRKPADPALLAQLAATSADAAGEIYARLTQVSSETGARIADDAGGEALTVALKAAGLTRAQFAGIVENRPDAEALKTIFETLSFNKARVLLTYWDWAAKRTGPYARIAAS